MRWLPKRPPPLLVACAIGAWVAAAAGCGQPVAEVSAPASAFPEHAIRERPLSDFVRHRLQRPALDPSQVQAALGRLADPPLRRWTELLHYVRLWRSEPFPGAQQSAERQLYAPLLDSAATRALLGRHYHVLTRHGVELRPGEMEKRDGELHQDATLALLALAGAPAQTPVEVDARTRTVADMVRPATANSYATQPEMEWTAVGLALYLAPGPGWQNKFGDRLSLDDCCRRLCESPLGAGSCGGTHVPFSLAVLLQADDQESVLSPDFRAAAIERLAGATELLAAGQLPDGSWGATWASESAAGSAAEQELSRVVVTSHSLEWLAIAPPEIRLEDRQVAEACEFVARRLLEASPDELRRGWCAYSHCGHALRWWCPEGWELAVSEWRLPAPFALAAAEDAGDQP